MEKKEQLEKLKAAEYQKMVDRYYQDAKHRFEEERKQTAAYKKALEHKQNEEAMKAMKGAGKDESLKLPPQIIKPV